MNKNNALTAVKTLILTLMLASTLPASASDTESGSEKNIEAGLMPIRNFVKPQIFGKALYHVCEGLPGILTMEFKVKTDTIKGLEIIMDMPEGFSVIGATPILPSERNSESTVYKAEEMSVEPILKNSSKYNRYILKANKQIINPKDWFWRNYGGEYVYVKADNGYSNPSGMVYWKLRLDGKTELAENSFEIKRLPALKMPERQLEKMGFFQCFLKSQIAPFREVRDAYLKLYGGLHKHPMTIWPESKYITPTQPDWANASPQEIKNEVEKVFQFCAFFSEFNGTGDFHHWYMAFKENKSGLEMEWRIRKDGKTYHSDGNPIRVCDTYLADFDNIFWNKLLPEYVSTLYAKCPMPQMLVMDYEPIPARGACYCEKCRKKFGEYLKIDKIPAVKEIETVYSKQWFEFQIERCGKVVENYSKSFKKFFPALPFWMCADPLHSNGTEISWCALNPRKTDLWVNGHMPMPYYSGTELFDDMALNVSTLCQPQYPLIAPTEPGVMYAIRYTPEKTLQNMMAVPANGGIGIGFWMHDDYDGLYISKIVEGCSLLSKTEEYYFAEKNDSLINVEVEPVYRKDVKDGEEKVTVALPDSRSMRYTVFRKDGRLLLTIFNYDESNHYVFKIRVLQVDEKGFNIYDVKSGKKLTNKDNGLISPEVIKEGILCSVEKCGVRQLLFIPQAQPQPETAGTISQDEFLKLFESIKDKYSNKFLEERKSGNSIISYGDIYKNRQIQLRLEQDGQKIYIDILNNAEIIGWKNNSPDSDIFNFRSLRGFCDQLMLYADYNKTVNRTDFNFKIISAEIIDGTPQVVFRFTVPPQEDASDLKNPQEGLVIEKTVRIENKGNTMNIKWKFRNEHPDKKDIPLACRLKIFPRFDSFMENTLISSLGQSGNIEIYPRKSPLESIFLAENNSEPALFKGKIKPQLWKYSPVEITAGTGQSMKKLQIVPDNKNTAGWFMWSDSKCYTVELLSTEFTLKHKDEITYQYSINKKD